MFIYTTFYFILFQGEGVKSTLHFTKKSKIFFLIYPGVNSIKKDIVCSYLIPEEISIEYAQFYYFTTIGVEIGDLRTHKTNKSMYIKNCMCIFKSEAFL